MSPFKGDYLAILDTDDIWYPKKLEKQLGYFSDSDVGICISNTLFFNSKRKRILYRKQPPIGYVTKNLLENYYISLETILIKMKYIKKLNIFFDKRFSHIADFDLITRLSTKCKLEYCPEILSGWRIHDENASFIENEKFLYEKINWINYYRKSNIFRNFQESMSNLEILIKSESIHSKKPYKRITVKDFFKFSFKFKSKIKIFFSFFPLLNRFLNTCKKISFFIKWKLNLPPN